MTPEQRERRGAEWLAQRESEKARRADLRRHYQADVRKVRNNRQLPRDAREAALQSLAAFRVSQRKALAEAIAVERQAFKVRHAPAEQYRVYLAERVEAGDVSALDELRRQRQRLPVEPTARYIEDDPAAADRAGATQPASLLRDLSYRVDREGVVTYYDQASRAVLTDTGRRVAVEQEERAVIEAGLRLASEKFGPVLSIKGTDNFKRQVVEISVDKGMRLEFADEAMNRQAREYAAGRDFLRAAPGSDDAQARAAREQIARDQQQAARQIQVRQEKSPSKLPTKPDQER